MPPKHQLLRACLATGLWAIQLLAALPAAPVQAQGAISFASGPGSPLTVGAAPNSVVSADFNRDGKLDLAVASVNAGTVTIFLGNGAGGFTPAPGSPIAVGTSVFNRLLNSRRTHAA